MVTYLKKGENIVKTVKQSETVKTGGKCWKMVENGEKQRKKGERL